MKTLISAAAVAGALAVAPAALAAYPAPSVVSSSLTPVVNAAARGHVDWRFARAVCVREATPGRYVCTAAHVRGGVLADGYSDVWEVVFAGPSRWRYGPTGACPLTSGMCVHTDFSPLTPG